MPRLIITMPPRHGKSELASRRFPAWYMGRNPRNQIIAASYGQDLASDFGREVRNIVGTQEYANLFPGVSLSEDSKAANRWHTLQGGVYVAVGVGGATTGRGAHVFLIDDPIKNREEADSEITRNRVWDWYTSTVRTRLMPKGSIVLILTRWHEDDLAGRLLEGKGHWEVLELPAIRDEKKWRGALWPEWYPADSLKEIKDEIGERDWSALYQQRPSPDEGTFFSRDWLHTYARPPARNTLEVYGASDYAVTKDGGDYTVHIVVGIDPDDNMYVLDLWREQADSAEWIEAFCDLVLEWKPLEWAEESGQINAAIGPFLKRRMIKRGAYVHRRQFPSKFDKSVRAQSIRARMSLQGIYLPADASWRSEFERELLAFPAGKHDDQVDSLSLVGMLLDHIQPGSRPKGEEPARFEYEGTNDGDMYGGLTIKELIERQVRRNRRED